MNDNLEVRRITTIVKGVLEPGMIIDSGEENNVKVKVIEAIAQHKYFENYKGEIYYLSLVEVVDAENLAN
ncbi:MAG: hypothetical protein Q4E36_04980 [Bacillota bacterium]|nr:hypothetical protein [Bacillota bacterium]